MDLQKISLFPSIHLSDGQGRAFLAYGQDVRETMGQHPGIFVFGRTRRGKIMPAFIGEAEDLSTVHERHAGFIEFLIRKHRVDVLASATLRADQDTRREIVAAIVGVCRPPGNLGPGDLAA